MDDKILFVPQWNDWANTVQRTFHAQDKAGSYISDSYLKRNHNKIDRQDDTFDTDEYHTVPQETIHWDSY